MTDIDYSFARVQKVAERDPEGWQEGNLQILFVSMGQGDCCVITCPDGRHVIVDCGSKAEEGDSSWHNVASLLRSHDVLRLGVLEKGTSGSAYTPTTHTVEALILTHPDKDHINKVKVLLGASNLPFAVEPPPPQSPPGQSPQPATRPSLKRMQTGAGYFQPIRVKNVYFSEPDAAMLDEPDSEKKRGRSKDTFLSSPLGLYTESQCNETILDGSLWVERISCVVISQTTFREYVWERPADSVFPANLTSLCTVKVLPDKCKEVASGTHDGKTWSIKIIAGSVSKNVSREQTPGAQDTKDASDTDGRNAGSLVTLIEYGAERILLCGDATFSTEDYLLSDNCPFKDKLKDLSLIQVGHHGSDVTSFQSALARHCKAKRAVFSVKRHEHSHHLPGQRCVRDAISQAAQGAGEEYVINFWEKVESEDAREVIAAWEAEPNKREEQDKQYRRARLVLDPVPAPSTQEQAIVLDGLQKGSKFLLYQQVTKKVVQQTGLHNHIWFYFDGEP